MERQQLQISFDFMMRKQIGQRSIFYVTKRVIAVTEKKQKHWKLKNIVPLRHVHLQICGLITEPFTALVIA